MQHRIFGRRVGAGTELKLVAIDEGSSPDASPGEPGRLDVLSLASARQATRVLRESGYEGCVLFEGDPTPYAFTPDADFVHLAACH
ncbi:hypothetical protein [Burkholderia gladioli]|uniref:hypothetical protein n=1 Tax=Burkholderia gladioli TaxID=28095 RepID=UPI000D0098E5|nr:hypothetical protein [Burkholderia gladioli]MBU9278294.1 hypothetical protein [Burkholderia gladioli]MDN7466270.1 hypothetical protein [Burkholderia gladioli]MDN7814456.1 hypothetical protein [Burkholderia gladioli]PRE23607.1 hypothetical protein C6P72_14700 [Burkholderia gladioli]PRG46607.1 hypothetical protein C6V06_28305 [Burkholderia gladioli]